MNILIRDVPDEVRDALADMARRQGQSLQAYLISLLRSQTAMEHNRRILERARRRGGGARDDGSGESIGAQVMRELRYVGEPEQGGREA